MTAAQQPLPDLPWFDVPDPASPALDELAQRFHLHELQIEDCRHPPQRAKTDDYGGYTFCILKHVRKKEDRQPFDDVCVFLGPDFLITVHRSTCPALDRLRTTIEQSKIKRLDQIFYRLVDEVVDGYLPVLDGVADQITDIESTVLDQPDPPMLRRIFRLKRMLVTFRRIATDMREVVNTLIRREHGMLGDDLDPYFRDIYDHLMRAVDLTESYRDLLTGSLDIYLSAVANRTNEVMKILTIWGTVALPLVIITGFFGMNLPLPWQNRPHGTWLAVGLMLVSTLIVLFYFKRKRWF